MVCRTCSLVNKEFWSLCVEIEIKGLPKHAASTFVLHRFVHSTSKSKENMRQHACVQNEAACSFLTTAPGFCGLKILHSTSAFCAYLGSTQKALEHAARGSMRRETLE